MKKLGKFEIIEKVGQGAMGVVYKARDPFIDRIVALKTLTTGLAEDANLLKRFYSEARSAGGLQHPNIVTIYELGHEGNTPFIAMQFLNGDSLDKIIDRRPNLPMSQKIGFIVYVCRALEYAHKQNPPVVHRDIKPGNVMVTTEGAVVVVDFGIARLGEGTRSQSAGMLIGTLGYMSPQLFRNSAADARSDIWATGVMFYELLAYRRPFEGDNAAALMSNIILEKPRSLDLAAPGTPLDLQAVVDRMLAKEADARYQNMEEVLMELEPVWRRLQQVEVSKLLVNGQQLFEAGDLESAKAKVSQIIQIDTSNTLAKSLLEKINAEVRRKQIVPQLKARVENAERLLVNGKVEEAKAEVEAALKLDSSFLPARELLVQAEAAIERARTIAQALRASKQRMAEGALTEAELQLDKVLEIDPGNAAAREQLKQLREERLRRQRRKQRDEILHRARTFWTNLQYEECINLLLDTQKEFPNDTEISKLLESARQDQADQQRQSLLAQARNLLRTQQFEEALHTLDRLLERFPSDPAAKNLRAHALQGSEQQRRELRLGEEKAKLRLWLKDGKYQEAIALAGQLRREFADDFELAELLDFARTEQAQFEQKRRLEQFSKQIQHALKESRFSEAVLAAEKALLEFPKNHDLLILLDRAKKEQSEKEKHEVLKQRLREVERLIDRQELTDAIDLARQTLATVGQDSRISDTLLKAEKEFEFREKKKRQQNETVQMARTLVDAGKLTDATSILKGALDTQLFSSSDPRVTKLLNEIDSRKEPPSTAAATADAAAAPSSPTLIGSPISSKPSADPGKDYVYQRGAPLPPPPSPVEQKAAAAAASANAGVTPAPQTVLPPVAPVTPPEKPYGKPSRESQRKQEVTFTGMPSGIEGTLSPFERTITDQPVPTGLSGVPVSPAEIFEPQTISELPTQEVPSPPLFARLLKKPKALVGAVVLVAGIGVAIYILLPTSPKTLRLTPEEINLQKDADKLFTDRHFKDARDRYSTLSNLHGAAAPAADGRIAEINAFLQHEDSLMEQAKASKEQDNLPLSRDQYQKVISLHGEREAEAQSALNAVVKKISGVSEMQIADDSYNQGVAAFNKRDYPVAKSALEQALRGPRNWPSRNQANVYLKRTQNRLEQEQHLRLAQSYFGSKDYEAAKNEANQAASIIDGDPLTKTAALNLISSIPKFTQPPANYAPVIAVVRTLIDQGRWDEASAKLTEVPTSQPEYSSLNSAIEKGKKIRVATQTAQELKQGGRYKEAMSAAEDVAQNGGDAGAIRLEIANAEAGTLEKLKAQYAAADRKNEASLRSLQSSFQQFQTNAATQAKSQEAAQYVASIANDITVIKAGPVVNPSDSRQASETEIRRLITMDLSKVFDDRIANELKDLWPQIDARTLFSYRSSFEDKSLPSLTRKYTVSVIKVNGDTATANGIWNGVHSRGGKILQNDQVNWTATLAKINGRWRITDLK